MTNRITQIKENRPLIHCITNPISIMQCANAILLLGGRPIMAEHPEEVAQITETSSALLLNLGNVTRDRIEAMKLSFQVANASGIPTVIDAVGVACSTLRRDLLKELLSKRNPALPLLIKGNYSEIQALTDPDYSASGVDADSSLSFEEATESAVSLAHTLKAIVLCTGPKDIVTDGERLAVIKNGTPQLGTITGTGCMLGAICATFWAVDTSLKSTALATAAFGICGENAKGDLFLMRLFDEIGKLSDADIEENMQISWE